MRALLFAFLLVLPLSASAATIADLQAQLTALMAQVAALQSQQTTTAAPQSGATSCPSLTRNLSRGMKGSDVTQLQHFLISQNLLAADSATGFFGAMTESAVKQWQAKNGIASSGTPATTGYGAVGPRTRNVMAASCKSANPTTLPTRDLCAIIKVSTSCPTGQYKIGVGDCGAAICTSASQPSQSAIPASHTQIPGTTAINPTSSMCSASAPLDGTFIDLESLSESRLEGYFAELEALHMKTIIVNATRAIGTSCAPSSYYWLPAVSGKLEKILTEADKWGMQVYVGLTSTMHQCDSVRNPAVFYEEPLATATKSDYRDAVSYIEQNFGRHTSLAGWYIPDEPNVVSWQLSLVYPYYRGLVDAIRSQSSKQILIAPYLVGARARTPEEVADRAKQFQENTGVDIQMWQDSVGTDAIPTNSRNGSDLSAYLHAIAGKIGSAKLWADVELFSYGTNKAGGWYSPTSIMRLNQQLWLAGNGSASKRVSWIGATHMSALSPSHASQAKRLLDAYRAMYCSVDVILKPVSYTWITPPSQQYPDSGTELTDTVTATPLSYNDVAWVGVPTQQTGNSKLLLDFGITRTIRWISLYMLHYALAGIEFPDTMTAECSVDNVVWNTIGAWDLPISKGDSEYVFSNDQPLSAQCRYVKITLVGGAWHFMSEVEIVGR